MSKNLVMGLAFGYDIDKIKPFVLSLRQYYDDDVLFVLSEPNTEMSDFLEEYDIMSFIPEEPLRKETCQIMRYSNYKDCLNDYFTETEHVLITDVRDVIFQDNPFHNTVLHELEFFAEPETFKNCTHNTPWINAIYGSARVKEIANEYILCSGTTMGTRKGIIKYCEEMMSEISKLEQKGRKVFAGEDQPIHNHVVYSGVFDNYGINQNGIGPISTMHHAKKLSFNRNGYLLNDNGEITPIVHQYDRLGAFSLVLLKNAFKLKGSVGIKTVSKYAVDNFFDHDL